MKEVVREGSEDIRAVVGHAEVVLTELWGKYARAGEKESVKRTEDSWFLETLIIGLDKKKF